MDSWDGMIGALFTVVVAGILLATGVGIGRWGMYLDVIDCLHGTECVLPVDDYRALKGDN